MNSLQVFILGTVIGLSACTGSDKKTPASEPDSVSTMKLAGSSNVITAAIDSTNSQYGQGWSGIYEGVLPCKECAGTLLKINLHADSTYMITVKYLTTRNSTETSWNGKFNIVNDSTIQLEGSRDIPSRYLIAENNLVQLGMDGKRVTGDLKEKYVLKRTDLKK